MKKYIYKENRGFKGGKVGRKKIENNDKKTYSLYLSKEEYEYITGWVKERRGVTPKESLGKMVRKYIDRYLENNYKCDYRDRVVDLSEKIKSDGLGKHIKIRYGTDSDGKLTEMAIKYLNAKI